jgi:hypothetical protein
MKLTDVVRLGCWISLLGIGLYHDATMLAAVASAGLALTLGRLTE